MSHPLSREVLDDLLRYEPDTGKLFWKERPRKYCKGDQWWKAFNAKYEGKEALTCKDNTGYFTGRIFGKKQYAHRIAWILSNGEIPDGYQVDHINQDRSDNPILNLRVVTVQGNRRNQKCWGGKDSGHAGVYQNPNSKNWFASIGVDYEQINLGTYKTIDEAVIARKAAEMKYGFSENHGRPMQ